LTDHVRLKSGRFGESSERILEDLQLAVRYSISGSRDVPERRSFNYLACPRLMNDVRLVNAVMRVMRLCVPLQRYDLGTVPRSDQRRLVPVHQLAP
jgi:hypothetical protein